MRADQLRSAANSVAQLLRKSGLLENIKRCREASDESALRLASRELGVSGNVILSAMRTMPPEQQAVIGHMHLGSLGSTEYWKSLIDLNGDHGKRRTELVNLYSRVVFATSHLPSLVALMVPVTPDATDPRPLVSGERRLVLQLDDAGERASNPDRLSRSIDSIDILYAACASLVRKPAIELELVRVVGSEGKQIYFVGDSEVMQAVATIVESIPAAIAEIQPQSEEDLQHVIDALPIFEDLETLADLGTFAPADIVDISESVHQGAMLALESGLKLQPNTEGDGAQAGGATQTRGIGQDRIEPARRLPQSMQQPNQAGEQGDRAKLPLLTAPGSHNVEISADSERSTASKQDAVPVPESKDSAANSPPANPAANPPANSAPANSEDEYYQQYLAERERLRRRDS